VELRHCSDLELANAFSCQIQDLRDLFECRTAAVGDIERTGFDKIGHTKIGEVQLDRSRTR
jgi:hypothetical protein